MAHSRFPGIGMKRGKKRELLMKAISERNTRCVRRLLDQGANVNSKHSHRGGNYQDVTPLMLATETGTPEIVKMLLSAGVNLEARNRAIMEDGTAGHGDTALNYAIRRGNRKIVAILLEAGANVDGGGGPSQSPLAQAIENNDLQLAKVLLAKGANVNRRSEHGTPLHKAIWEGKLRFVKLLIANGADLEAVSVTGAAPLPLAAYCRQRKMIEFLLKSGADINAQETSNGKTALMWAVRMDALEIVELLLNLGAGLHVKDEQGRTALGLAEERLRPWIEDPQEIVEVEKVLRRRGDSVAAFRNGYRRLEKIVALLRRREGRYERRLK